MKRPFETALYGTFRYLPGRCPLPFFLVFFLLNIFVGRGQNDCTISSLAPDPTEESPIPIDIVLEASINRELVADDFVVINGNIGNIERDKPEFVKGAEDIEIENFQVQGDPFEILSMGIPEFLADEFGDAVISISQYTEDDIFYLTYSNGVKTLNLVTENKQATSISGGNLSSPLDIEASLPGSNQKLYLADKGEQQVNVYNNSATAKIDDFKVPNYDSSNDVGPTGIVTDSFGNIFVAVAFTPSGTYDVEYDKVAVYQPGNYNNPIVFPPDDSEIKLDRPYRIAVDKTGRVYVADSGGSTSNGRVLIFDENYNHIHTIEGAQDNIGAPGSVVVDDFGYIYVIDYQDDITFNGIFQNPEDLISEYDKITSTSYSINVYDSNANFEYVTEFNQGLNLPVDLEIDYCGNILVNNLELTGPAPGIFSGIDVNFDFQLKTFTRYDNFTAEVTPESEGLVKVNLNSDNSFFLCDPQPECEFSITYETEQTQEPVVTCPQNSALPELPLDANCDYQLPDWGDLITTENFTPTFKVVNENEVNNKLQIDVEVLNGTDLIEICSLEFDLVDNIEPLITSCPEDENISLAPGETYTVPNYQPMIGISDNCDSGPEYSQTPIPGAEISENTPVNITVTDASGNVSDVCSFEIIIKEKEVFEINCKDSYTVELGLNESVATIPTEEFVNGDTSGIDFELNEQYFDCSDIGTFPLVINAKDSQTGETASCTVEVTVLDKGAPLLICQASTLQYSFPAGGSFEVPNLYENRVIDNCDDLEDLTIVQNPPVGTKWDKPGTYTVTYSATDTYGNYDDCTVTIELSEEQGPFITCPDENDIAPIILDEDCDFEEPDYTSEVGTGNFTNSPTITQSLQRVDNTLEVEIEVFDGQDYIGTCNFSVDIIDDSDPEIVCPTNISKEIPSEENSAIINYTPPQVQDNCDNAPKLELIAGYESGEAFPLGSTTVTWRVTDDSGNQTECSFIVLISQEDGSNPTNSAPVANDDSYSVDQHDVLNKAAPGVLENDTDAENDVLSVILKDGPQYGTLSLNSDGSFTYEPNAGYSGPDSFTYIANDGTANSNVATVSITVNSDNSGSDFQCKDEITLQLDASGAASLQLTDLYTGDASGLNLVASQLDFTCDNIGENTIELSWTGQSNDSCEIKVIVEDNIKPVAQVSFISVTLDENGLAEVAPEDLDDGSYDNCGDLTFSLDKTRFTCEDTGQNSVSFTITDASGNSSSINTIVSVNANPGTCTEPVRDNDYVFLYPNPTDGLVKISTPQEVTVEQVFVFDKRGRLILSKDFDKSDLEYELQIDGVQNAVYTLQLLTNEGEIIRRLIIRN
ncbi:HYR domain-containing protein [Salegentibacter sediminis]|uniref:HYR domain-containing protein n=1 Tax=Salegentibacter sediminis TaxID=1930251 RepID=UPI0009BF780D|nr:Ig-like domain-containing protein [Salegentibacter sediminis]